MKYKESNLDRSLKKWFINDNDHNLLRVIKLTEGNMRGLSSFSMSFDYPITAISGKNGSGKSTILALVCCAFHNSSNGFKLPNRKQPYYTFADFFVQHAEDIPPEGLQVFYGIAHNNWKKTDINSSKKGVRFQKRVKKKGGKWNNYDQRIKREVVFLGIDRIVPHSEKSQSKSYSKSFLNLGDNGWENDVKEIVGNIIGKKYDDFKYVSYSKYRLPLVTSNGKRYSGFNMGAGENALFEMFSVIFSVSEGALVVIDEIELGLHSEAQKKFIRHLKEVCKKRKIQIVCTTHSKDIFNELPDEARMFIENINGKTIVTDSISSDFAFSKLSAENQCEISLLVEDVVAKKLLLNVLPSSIRSRVSVEVIGSATSLSRQLAANYTREKREKIVVVFDGDQVRKEKSNLEYGHKMAETKDKLEDVKVWMRSNIEYLPGDTWPESWIIQTCSETIDILSSHLRVGEDELTDIIEQGLGAGKHNEFNEIGNLVGLDEQEVLNRFCATISQAHHFHFRDIINSIENKLDGN